MKTQRIYLDTSVIGGCFDEEFAQWSNALLKEIDLGLHRCVTSSIVAAEMVHAPKRV